MVSVRAFVLVFNFFLSCYVSLFFNFFALREKIQASRTLTRHPRPFCLPCSFFSFCLICHSSFSVLFACPFRLRPSGSGGLLSSCRFAFFAQSVFGILLGFVFLSLLGPLILFSDTGRHGVWFNLFVFFPPVWCLWCCTQSSGLRCCRTNQTLASDPPLRAIPKKAPLSAVVWIPPCQGFCICSGGFVLVSSPSIDLHNSPPPQKNSRPLDYLVWGKCCPFFPQASFGDFPVF